LWILINLYYNMGNLILQVAGTGGAVSFVLCIIIAVVLVYFTFKIYKCYFRLCNSIEDIKLDLHKMYLIMQSKQYREEEKEKENGNNTTQ
jgi:uncharacterized membrane protein